MEPLNLPPGTDRQLWTLTLGAPLAMRGEDDAMTPVVLDELKASPAGGGPLLLAFSTTLATLLTQHYPDPVGTIRGHLAEIAADADEDEDE